MGPGYEISIKIIDQESIKNVKECYQNVKEYVYNIALCGMWISNSSSHFGQKYVDDCAF